MLNPKKNSARGWGDYNPSRPLVHPDPRRPWVWCHALERATFCVARIDIPMMCDSELKGSEVIIKCRVYICMAFKLDEGQSHNDNLDTFGTFLSSLERQYNVICRCKTSHPEQSILEMYSALYINILERFTARITDTLQWAKRNTSNLHRWTNSAHDDSWYNRRLPPYCICQYSSRGLPASSLTSITLLLCFCYNMDPRLGQHSQDWNMDVSLVIHSMITRFVPKKTYIHLLGHAHVPINTKCARQSSFAGKYWLWIQKVHVTSVKKHM